MLEHTQTNTAALKFVVADGSSPQHLVGAPLLLSPGRSREQIRKELPKDVPQPVLDHIAKSEEVVGVSENGSMSIKGTFVPVRKMIYADFVEGRARGPYECQQGVDDFGWLHPEQPGWKKPRVVIEKNGNEEKFDGVSSFEGSDSFAWVNHGILDTEDVITLGENQSVIENEKLLRDGGFGQGLKIMMMVAVSSTEDKINILRFHKEHTKETLNNIQQDAIDATIDRLERIKKTETGETPFVTVQSKREDGSYYRAYAYRHEIKNSNTWKWAYVVCDIDPAKVPSKYQDMVVVRVHKPDTVLAQAFDHASENLLALNPTYGGEHSLVRRENDPRPVAPRREYRSSELQTNITGGAWRAERLDIYPPRLFFRGTAMKSREHPNMILESSWNIDDVDAALIQKINRTNDSTEVTGDVRHLIETCVGMDMSADDWERVFRRVSELEQIHGENFGWLNRPELRPFIPDRTRFNEDEPDPVRDQIREAFDRVWQNSGGMYATSQEEVDVWNILSGSQNENVPILDGLYKADQHYLSRLLGRAGIKSLTMELYNVLRDTFQLSQSNSVEYARLSGSQQESLSRQPQLTNPADEIFQFILGENAGIDFRQVGHSIRLNEKGEIELVLENYTLPGVVGLTNHGGIFDSPGKSQIDEYGNEYFIQTNEHSSATSSEAHAMMRLPRFLLQMKQLGLNVEIEAPDGQWMFSERYSKLTSGTFGEESIIAQGRNPTATTFHERYQVVRISGRSAVEMNAIVDQLYEQTAMIDPAWAARADLSSIQRTTQRLQVQEKTMKVQLENQRQELERLRAEMRSEVVITGEGGLNVRAQQENAGTIGQTRRHDGVPIRQEFPESAHATTRGKYLISNANGRAAGLDTKERRLEKRKSTSKSEYVRDEPVKFDVPHFRYFWYGDEVPNFYPQESYDHSEFTPDGILLSTSEFDFVGAGTRSDGDTVWRGYRTDKKKEYIDRQTKGGEPIYDGYLEMGLGLVPGDNGECILPIDGRQYEIAYIQIPVRPGETPVMPRLLYDRIGQQYHTIAVDKSHALKVIPKGTVIYLKEREQIPTRSDEGYLQDVAPGYYAQLTQPVSQFEKLDCEAQFFLQTIGTMDLTRRQKVRAVYEFWVKRRRYDDDGMFKRAEDLIQNGVGCCEEGAFGEADLIRLLHIPVRFRAGFSDNNQSGRLAPPGHFELEFLDDEGMWQRHDPPNARVTKERADEVTRAILNNEKPIIHDAPPLNREKQEFGELDDLPPDAVELLATIQVLPGEESSPQITRMQEQLLRGEDTGISELKLLQMVTAAAVSKKKDKPSKPVSVNDALLQQVQQARESRQVGTPPSTGVQSLEQLSEAELAQLEIFLIQNKGVKRGRGSATQVAHQAGLHDLSAESLAAIQQTLTQTSVEQFSTQLQMQLQTLDQMSRSGRISPRDRQKLQVRMAQLLTGQFVQDVLGVDLVNRVEIDTEINVDNLTSLFDHPNREILFELSKRDKFMADVLADTGERYRAIRFQNEWDKTPSQPATRIRSVILTLETHPRRSEIFELVNDIAVTYQNSSSITNRDIGRFDTLVHELSQTTENEFEREKRKMEIRSALHQIVRRQVVFEKEKSVSFDFKQRDQLARLELNSSIAYAREIGRNEAEIHLPGMIRRAYEVSEFSRESVLAIERFCTQTTLFVREGGLMKSSEYFDLNYEMAMIGDAPFFEMVSQQAPFRSLEEEFFSNFTLQMSDERCAHLFQRGGALHTAACQVFTTFLRREFPTTGKNLATAVFPTTESMMRYANEGMANSRIFESPAFSNGNATGTKTFKALHEAYSKFLQVNYPKEYAGYMAAFKTLPTKPSAVIASSPPSVQATQ